MTFEGQMSHTPEGQASRAEIRKRALIPPNVLAREYVHEAGRILKGKNSVAVREEVGRFAKEITTARVESEQDEYLERLTNALSIRKLGVFADIPDDKHERAAFLFALIGAYQRALH
ncbi:MAG: hypothetical protein Q7S50_02360 [bacterium]|nr:hypothetical protein [bacterium]